MRSFLPRAPMIGLAVVVADQASKAFARALLPLCAAKGCPTLRVLGPVGFLRVENRGSAFGLAQGLGLWTGLALIGLALLPVIARRSGTPAGRLGAWLLLGGALANLLDRLASGGVTDLLDPGGFIVFNLADVALVFGCLLSTHTLVKATDPARRDLVGSSAP